MKYEVRKTHFKGSPKYGRTTTLLLNGEPVLVLMGVVSKSAMIKRYEADVKAGKHHKPFAWRQNPSQVATVVMRGGRKVKQVAADSSESNEALLDRVNGVRVIKRVNTNPKRQAPSLTQIQQIAVDRYNAIKPVGRMGSGHRQRRSRAAIRKWYSAQAARLGYSEKQISQQWLDIIDMAFLEATAIDNPSLLTQQLEVHRREHELLKRNPSPPTEWDDLDDDILDEGARLGSQMARALGRSEREHRQAAKYFNVTWYSKQRGKRTGFMRPIEAHNARDAVRQAKAMITNEKSVSNFVAKEARRNPRGGKTFIVSGMSKSGQYHALTITAFNKARAIAMAKAQNREVSDPALRVMRWTAQEQKRNPKSTGRLLKLYEITKGGKSLGSIEATTAQQALVKASAHSGDPIKSLRARLTKRYQQREFPAKRNPFEKRVYAVSGDQHGNPNYVSLGQVEAWDKTEAKAKAETIKEGFNRRFPHELRLTRVYVTPTSQIVATVKTRGERGKRNPVTGPSDPMNMLAAEGIHYVTSGGKGAQFLKKAIGRAEVKRDTLSGKARTDATKLIIKAKRELRRTGKASVKHNPASGNMYRPCPRCKGSGLRKGGDLDCANCNGMGVVLIDLKTGKRTTSATDVSRHRPYKSNPSTREMSQRFNGHASGAVSELKAATSAPGDLSRAGRLVLLKLVDANKALRIPGAVVCIDPKTERLWIAGNRSPLLNRKAKPGERLNCGEIDRIVYETAKRHIGNGKTYEYDHKFGEDGGKRPSLYIDAEGMPLIVGGDYKIRREGIVN